MKINSENIQTRFSKVRESSSWNNQTKNELRMHKIHVYPAKFPSFLISKSLQYAKERNIEINTMGDIFCGCGTTALEAKKNNKDFWGCDINPVATLIAKVKRENYDTILLNEYFEKITLSFERSNANTPRYILSNKRITYWFTPNQTKKLYILLSSINRNVPEGKYRDFFLVAFSNILKKTSRWLMKSIKPTIDKTKKAYNVLETFEGQYKMMYKAVEEANKQILSNPVCTIENTNFLNVRRRNTFLDMIITSPPYVTSYEYADLHQLSTLWLGYVKDYRELRKGTIGSVYHESSAKWDIENLNEIGTTTYNNLVGAKAPNPKSALKYFIDIKKTVDKSYSLINPGGLAVFVVGNTTHKNVYIDNAKYLTKCMFDTGFNEVNVYKRKISSKILTPYRDKTGKFSNNKRHKQIYSYEYIVIAQKPH